MSTLESVVLTCEQSAYRRSETEHGEVVPGDEFACHTFGFPIAAKAHRGLTKTEHAIEHAAAVAKVLIHRIRDPVPALVAAIVLANCAEKDKLLRILNWKQPDQNLICQGENGCVRTDAESNGEDRHGHKKGRLGKRTQSKPDIG